MIKVVVTDCDGTLTDGKYYYSESGRSVTYHTNDSYASQQIKECGVRLVMISSGHSGNIHKKRAMDVGAEYIYAPVGKKLEIIKSIHANLSEVAYIGDCFDDVPALQECALSFCPSTALPEVQKDADLILIRAGGEGCLLEAWLRILDYNSF